MGDGGLSQVEISLIHRTIDSFIGDFVRSAEDWRRTDVYVYSWIENMSPTSEYREGFTKYYENKKKGTGGLP